jgi:hypothetical protein
LCQRFPSCVACQTLDSLQWLCCAVAKASGDHEIGARRAPSMSTSLLNGTATIAAKHTSVHYQHVTQQLAGAERSGTYVCVLANHARCTGKIKGPWQQHLTNMKSCMRRHQLCTPLPLPGIDIACSSSFSCTCICITNHFLSLTDTAASASAMLSQHCLLVRYDCLVKPLLFCFVVCCVGVTLCGRACVWSCMAAWPSAAQNATAAWTATSAELLGYCSAAHEACRT